MACARNHVPASVFVLRTHNAQSGTTAQKDGLRMEWRGPEQGSKHSTQDVRRRRVVAGIFDEAHGIEPDGVSAPQDRQTLTSSPGMAQLACQTLRHYQKVTILERHVHRLWIYYEVVLYDGLFVVVLVSLVWIVAALRVGDHFGDNALPTQSGDRESA